MLYTSEIDRVVSISACNNLRHPFDIISAEERRGKNGKNEKRERKGYNIKCKNKGLWLIIINIIIIIIIKHNSSSVCFGTTHDRYSYPPIDNSMRP